MQNVYCLGYYPYVIFWGGNKVGNKIWQEIEMKSLVDVVNEIRAYDTEREIAKKELALVY